MSYISFQPKDNFNTVLYTGNQTARTITVGMQPDFTWTKARNQAHSHIMTDVVTGVGKRLRPNVNNAQDTSGASVASFVSTGYTLTDNDTINENSTTHVSWNWKAGGGQGSSNTDGSINTTYTSANTTSGFSISKYAGNGSAGATIGHGLGAIPQVIIVKNLSQAEHWIVYHHKSNATPEDYYFRLNTDAAASDFEMWNDTAPTSSVFSLGTNDAVNHNGSNHVAYCFAEKKGFSKFGSYVGNGNADGAFIYTGFKPAFVMIKYAFSGGSGNWTIYDPLRDGYNDKNDYLYANENNAESGITHKIDLLSNGFKCRANSSDTNTSGGTMIYMAFAAEPLVSSNGLPATAR